MFQHEVCGQKLCENKGDIKGYLKCLWWYLDSALEDSYHCNISVCCKQLKHYINLQGIMFHTIKPYISHRQHGSIATHSQRLSACGSIVFKTESNINTWSNNYTKRINYLAIQGKIHRISYVGTTRLYMLINQVFYLVSCLWYIDHYYCSHPTKSRLGLRFQALLFTIWQGQLKRGCGKWPAWLI